MVINDVIGLELDNKCMPNRINELGVHVGIYMYMFMLCVFCLFGLARVLSCVES